MFALFVAVTKLKNLETFDAAVDVFNTGSVAANLRIEPFLVISKFAAFRFLVGRQRIGMI